MRERAGVFLWRERAGFVLHGSSLRVLALMWPRSSITERETERRTTPIKVSLRVHCALIGRRVYLALKLKRIPRASTHCSCICAGKKIKKSRRQGTVVRCVHARVDVSAYGQMCAHVCACAGVNTRRCAFMCVRVRACGAYIYIHIYICVHTHIHIHTRACVCIDAAPIH